MTIDLSEDLECFIRELVSAGRYTSQEAVVGDALIRLRQVINADEETSDASADPCRLVTPLTKQEFQRHLVRIGLLDETTETMAAPGNSQRTTIDPEEIVDEVVIRERLIEWLTGFLGT